MKTLLFLLIPLLSFAQNQLPDTLYLIDGRTTPCLITAIDDDRMYFNYGNNRSEAIVLKALENASIDGLGTVYKKDSGFTTDKDDVIAFIENRADNLIEQQEINNELNRLSLVPVEEEVTEEITQPITIEFTPEIKNKNYKKWSFGVLLIPYSSGTTYRVIKFNSTPPDFSIYNYQENNINLEAQLSYGIIRNLRITLDAGYRSSFSESHDEYHFKQEGYGYDNGTINTVGLKLFDFTLGLKYYFKNFIKEKVNIYASAGFGKQIAFAQNKYEALFLNPPPVIIINEDNIEEFTEELNSPWHFNIGFGAEYFFNESLSLTSNIRLLYSSVTGNYDLRYIYDNQSITRTRDYTFRDFITHIGLGLNFYF
jgi:hypothetical protein